MTANDRANEILPIMLTLWRCYLVCRYSPNQYGLIFTLRCVKSRCRVTYGSGACLFPLLFSYYKQKWALKTLSAHCWLFLSGRMYCPLRLALAVWNENNLNVKGLSPSPVLSISSSSRQENNSVIYPAQTL